MSKTVESAPPVQGEAYDIRIHAIAQATGTPMVCLVETFRRIAAEGADPSWAAKVVLVLVNNGMSLDRAFKYAQQRLGVSQVGLVPIEAIDGGALPGEQKWIRLERWVICFLLIVLALVAFGGYWLVASLSPVAAGCLGSIAVVLASSGHVAKQARRAVAQYRAEGKVRL